MVRFELVAFPDINSEMHNIGEEKYLFFNIFFNPMTKTDEKNKLYLLKVVKPRVFMILIKFNLARNS